MAKELRLRRGTTAEHSTFTGSLGEVTVDTTKDTVVVHDGTTVGGVPLAKENLSNVPSGAVTSAMLANTAVTPGTYTSANITVDAKGRVTDASSGVATRGGITTVTLTSASPNATLTAASNQYIVVQNDSTSPAAPSLTLPNMTTLTTGSGYFVIANTAPYPIEIRDSTGVAREFMQSGTTLTLNIRNNGTATGVWSVGSPPSATTTDFRLQSTLSTLVPGSGLTATFVRRLRISPTHFVQLHVIQGSSTLVAQLFTLNPSTGAFTAGNSLNVATNFSWGSSYADFLTCVADSDDANHAFVVLSYNAQVATSQARVSYFGLSVSGGTLYTSAVTTVNGPSGVACSSGAVGGLMACGYLGSNNAFALIFYLGLQAATHSTTVYVRGIRVTGTTTVTLTESASNTTFTGSSTAYPPAHGYAARTGLASFVAGAFNTVGRAILYSPGANTLTVTTRTNQARLDIEQGAIAESSSFNQGGYMYSSSKSYFGATVFDITNEGAAGVTAVASTAFNLKPSYSAGYQSSQGASFGYTPRSAIYVSGTSVVALGSSARLQCDPSSSTLNLQTCPGTGSLGTTGQLFDSSNGYVINSTVVSLVKVATPLSA